MSLACNIGKAIEREGQRIVDEMSDLVADVKNTSGSTPFRAAAHGLKLYYYSNDGVIRTIASSYGKDGQPEPTIEKIADMLFAPPGRKEKTGVARTAAESIDRQVLSAQNKLGDLLEPFEDMRPAQQEQVRKQIIRKITTGTIKPGASAADDAAEGIKSILKDWLAYAKESGVEIGDVGPKYFPRELDTAKVLSEPDVFKRMAEKAYRAAGAGDEAKDLADAWFTRVQQGDLGFRSDGNDFVQIQKGTGTQFEKGRALGPEADKILENFYLRDPVDVLASYFTRLARRAEFTRRFGGDKWTDLKKEMEANGAGEAIPEVRRTIQSAFGMVPQLEGSFARNLVAFGRVYGAVRFLTRATFSSLTEPLVIAIRSGNVADALKAYSTTIQDMLKQITGVGDINGRIDALRDLAEDLGLVSALGDQMLMTARIGGDSETKLTRKIMSQFFVRTGLHHFTEATRVAAVGVGRAFLRRQALQITKKGIFEKSSRFLLGELGIKDVDGFAKWVAGHKDAMPDIESLQASVNAEVQQYRDALARFAEQAILKPRAIEKPRYANHPVGVLFYQLQSYIYGFQKNVLNRVGNLSVDALGRNKDLNVADRIRLMAPAGLLPMLLAGQAGLQEIREAWLDDPGIDPKYKDKTPAEEMMLLMSRAALFGTADLPINIATGVKYARSPEQTLLGPTLGAPGELINTVVKMFTDENSPNTNTAERKMAKVAYEAVIAPAIMTALSLLPGKSGALLAAALMQTVRTPSVREKAFIEPVAGQPKFKTGSGGRGSSRGGGSRSSGRSGGGR